MLSRRVRAYIGHNHLALIALIVAVVGVPTAWAIGKNSIGTKQLKPNAVRTPDIRNGAVTSSKIGGDQVTGAQVAEGTLGEVPSALRAQSAQSADSATTAETAGSAQTAATATTAQSADTAANAQTLDGKTAATLDDGPILFARVSSTGSVDTATAHGLTGGATVNRGDEGVYCVHLPGGVSPRVATANSQTDAGITSVRYGPGLDCNLAADIHIDITDANGVHIDSALTVVVY